MKFDWELDDDAEPHFHEKTPTGRPPRRIRWRMILAGTLLAVVAAGLGWWRIGLFDDETERFLQSAVDLQTNAVINRDGDLYLTNYSGNPTGNYKQIHPHQINFWMSHPDIVDYELFEKEIWAQAEWVSADNERLYRMLFFDDVNASVRLRNDSRTYWQGSYTTDLSHMQLTLTERDRPFELEFRERINPVIETYCRNWANPAVCADFTMTIGSFSFTPTNEFEFVSPRLYGLTADDEIPESYWDYFDNRLQDLIGDNTIRFGVPDPLVVKVQLLVEQFESVEHGRNRRIDVELVPYDVGTVDYVELAKTVDGMFFEPKLDVVTSGAILPVGHLATGQHTDFYPQHWASAWWQDQMWFLPFDGEMFFISYDISYARHADNPQDRYPNWTWDEFTHVMDVYSVDQGLKWGIVSPNGTILLSKAYNHANRCQDETRPIYCSLDLPIDAVEDALIFYADNSHQISIPPAMSVHDQVNHFVTQASVSAQLAGMWVSRPQFFEHDRTTRGAIVQPFPRSDHSAPISPLIVRGGSISSFSDSPITTWEFISWLSHHPMSAAERTVPARPRTVVESGIWGRLPPEVATIMRSEFETSRPVRLGDQEYFRPEILDAVANGSQTPSAAARVRLPKNWFSAYFDEFQQAN